MKNTEEVMIQSEVLIKGTIFFPEKNVEEKVPAVLFMNGSGACNRDGNFLKPELTMNLYKDLALKMREWGIASLRYDKRGVGESEGDSAEVGMWDLVKDAKEAVSFLENHPQIDKNQIYIIGHSEGAILALAVNQSKNIKGLILLAGGGENLREVLQWQRNIAMESILQMPGFKGLMLRTIGVPRKISKQTEKLLNKVLESKANVIRYQYQKLGADWFKEHFAFSVEDALTQTECPVLAINGEKDIQSNPATLKNIKTLVKGDCEIYMIPNVNHMLKEQKEDLHALNVLKSYKDQINQPISSEVLKTIREWLQKQIKSNPSN